MFECNGNISMRDGSCSGTLRKGRFKDKEDFCYLPINVAINNWYCISNGPVNFSYNKGKTNCANVDNGLALAITKDAYSELCGSGGLPVTYKYFTEEVEDHSADVHCSDTKPYVCTLTEHQDTEVVYSGGSKVHTQSIILLLLMLCNFFIFV